MKLFHRARSGYDHWQSTTYPRLGPVLLIFCLLTSVFASTGVLILTRVQGQEAERRQAAITELQACFDAFATDTSGTSRRTRYFANAVTNAEAEVARWEQQDALAENATVKAQRARGAALLDLIDYVAIPIEDRDPVTGTRLYDRLRKTQRRLIKVEDQAIPIERQLAKAYADYVDANEALLDFRYRNPVPQPPSEFCSVEPPKASD